MTSYLNLENIEVASPERPNEVCLTLYFIDEEGVDYRTRIREFLQPQVGGWKVVEELNLENSAEPKEWIQRGFLGKSSPKDFQQIYLLEILPALSSNAYAVQIIINLTQPIQMGWPQATNWLSNELYMLFKNPPESLLGYSVVYRANSSVPSETEYVEWSSALTQPLRWIDSKAPIVTLKKPVQQYFSGQGWLSLVAYPMHPQGGLVYLGFGKADPAMGDDLAHIAYATYEAELLSCDLFFHKGFRQGMQLVQAFPTYDREKLQPLQGAIQNLLSSQPKDQPVSEKELRNMSNEIAIQAEFHWLTSRVELSLQQQINGIKRLFTFNDMSVLAKHHVILLQAYLEEVQACRHKGESLLKTARTALAIVEAEENKQGNQIQERFTNVLTLFGVFLSAYQVFDDDFTKHFIQLFWLNYAPKFYWDELIYRNTIALLVTASIYIPYKLINWGKVKRSFFKLFK
ncbi:hypothetical protein BWI96_06005 [Siphonobacter sp. SORGH_AS_0500]|uniref:hypothetical protein n=1 Tax=Siphonobacter sp. SORGH_AS_0500 TaxID=1864824 RepID=UPI000CC8B1BF|nr:hypothetical protein [Siphonobacter sp. SORGH_AS_0500]PKK37421.1 hypothetical protein BWI96_06005 [Siphonobacter sp. SORGH_AS_0500]